MRLIRGHLRTTYAGKDEKGKPIPYGYAVDPPERRAANCIADAESGEALAEVWKSTQGGFVWCTRGDELGKAPSREEALEQAEAALRLNNQSREDAAQ